MDRCSVLYLEALHTAHSLFTSAYIMEAADLDC